MHPLLQTSQHGAGENRRRDGVEHKFIRFLPGTDPGGRHGAAAASLNPGEIPGFPGAGSHTRTHCPQKLRKRAPDAAISRHQACTAGNRAFGFMQRNFNCPSAVRQALRMANSSRAA